MPTYTHVFLHVCRCLFFLSNFFGSLTLVENASEIVATTVTMVSWFLQNQTSASLSHKKKQALGLLGAVLVPLSMLFCCRTGNHFQMSGYSKVSWNLAAERSVWIAPLPHFNDFEVSFQTRRPARRSLEGSDTVKPSFRARSHCVRQNAKRRLLITVARQICILEYGVSLSCKRELKCTQTKMGVSEGGGG